MKKHLLKFSFLLLLSNSIQAQCSVSIANNITMGCAPLEVLFACPAVNTGTITWNMDGTNIQGNSVNHIFNTPGSYTVIVSASIPTSSGVCTATASTLINVVTGPAYGCSTTVMGIKYLSNENDFVFYPNPNMGDYKIEWNGEGENVKMILVNSLGQKIQEEKLIRGTNSFEHSYLNKGIYFLSIYRNEKRLVQRKMIIE